MLMGLRAVGHVTPPPSKRPWSQWPVAMKYRYARANLRHANSTLDFLTHHRRFYTGPAYRRLVLEHAQLRAKSARNVRVLYAVLHPLPTTIPGIICYVWGDQCSNALAVVRCESNFSIYNHTGQYWGLFQMGAWARAKYGFAYDAWQQARAAHELYLDMGWGPWECARIVGIIW